MTYTQNDYTPLERLLDEYQRDGTFAKRDWQRQAKVSVIIATYNQEEQLQKQLAALAQQTYDPNNIEVVIADDGSRRGTGSSLDYVTRNQFPFDVKYVWQPDAGFRLAKVRNEAIKRASHETIISIDADMIPNHRYIEEVMKWHYAAKQQGTTIMTTQDRGFVELKDNPNFDQLVKEKRLSQIKRACSRRFGGLQDWRHDRYEQTSRLKVIPESIDDPTYFIGTTLSGGNCSFHKADAFEAGLFDEAFIKYGAEDSEFGVRLYEHFNRKLGRKLLFVPVDTMAYHLEHGSKVDQTQQRETADFFWQRLTQARARKVDPLPEVSVYMPCYNQASFLEKAVHSIARQNFDSSTLEVVIGDDGSTDRSKAVIQDLQKRYQGKLKIRLVDDNKNHGMADNTNRIIQACRGKYIIQLDSDDELLPAAVKTLYHTLQRHPEASLAFGDCIDRDVASGETRPHWSCNEFTEQWYQQHPKATTQELVDIVKTGMRVHPPRMFRRDAFFRMEGVNPMLQNAVDYDLYIKLMETGRPIHVKQPLYVYNINHGDNTTTKGRLQAANDHVVKRETDLRNGTQREKTVYVIDESPKQQRNKRFDLNNPTARYGALYPVWDQEEKRKEGTPLYRAMVQELQDIVGFFRWVQPQTSRRQLEQLLQLQPTNNVGLYFLATFLHCEGKRTEALNALRRITPKGPSALALEQRLTRELAA